MKANTRLFGEIDIPEEKIITFEQGLMGFEDCRKFTIIYDTSKEEETSISWLQSMELPELAFPVISPFSVMEKYNPIVESEWLEPLGEVNDDNLVISQFGNIKIFMNSCSECSNHSFDFCITINFIKSCLFYVKDFTT